MRGGREGRLPWERPGEEWVTGGAQIRYLSLRQIAMILYVSWLGDTMSPDNSQDAGRFELLWRLGENPLLYLLGSLAKFTHTWL